jgi:hypothetical protein
VTNLPDADRTASMVDEALDLLHRLEMAWPLLAALVAPSGGLPTPRPTRPAANELQQAAATRERVLDRRAAVEARRNRRVPTADRPTAANMSAVSTRRQVVEDISRLADRVWAYGTGADTDRGWRLGNVRAGTVTITDRCRDCNGTGTATRPRWWDDTRPWPAVAPGWHPPLQLQHPACPRCTDGTIYAQQHVSASDSLLWAAINLLQRQLVVLEEPEVAADALRTIRRAERATVGAAGGGEDRRAIPARCPCCGQRSLYAEVSHPHPRGWYIACSSTRCVCTGPRCVCKRPTRWAGRRHTWPSREWHSPGGLADLLGVELPALVDAAGQPVTEWNPQPLEASTVTSTPATDDPDVPNVEVHVRIVVPARLIGEEAMVYAVTEQYAPEELCRRTLAATAAASTARSLARAARSATDLVAEAAGKAIEDYAATEAAL